MASGSSAPTDMQVDSEGGGAASQQSALDKLAWRPSQQREKQKRDAEPDWYQFTSAVFVEGKDGEQFPHKQIRNCIVCGTACNGLGVWVEHVLGDSHRYKKSLSVTKCTQKPPSLEVKAVALAAYNERMGIKQQKTVEVRIGRVSLVLCVFVTSLFAEAPVPQCQAAFTDPQEELMKSPDLTTAAVNTAIAEGMYANALSFHVAENPYWRKSYTVAAEYGYQRGLVEGIRMGVEAAVKSINQVGDRLRPALRSETYVSTGLPGEH